MSPAPHGHLVVLVLIGYGLLAFGTAYVLALVVIWLLESRHEMSSLDVLVVAW